MKLILLTQKCCKMLARKGWSTHYVLYMSTILNSKYVSYCINSGLKHLSLHTWWYFSKKMYPYRSEDTHFTSSVTERTFWTAELMSAVLGTILYCGLWVLYSTVHCVQYTIPSLLKRSIFLDIFPYKITCESTLWTCYWLAWSSCCLSQHVEPESSK